LGEWLWHYKASFLKLGQWFTKPLP